MGISKPWEPASTRGMHYMSNTPEAIAGDVFDSIEGARADDDGDLMGVSIQDRIQAEIAKQAAAQVIEAAKDALSGFGLNFHPLRALKTGLRLSARPFTYQANLAHRLMHKAAHAKLPGEGGGGGGGGGGGPAPPPDEGGQEGGGDEGGEQDSSTEGRLLGMLQSPGGASRISYLEGAFPGFISRIAARIRRRARRAPSWRGRSTAPAAAAGFSLSSVTKYLRHAKPAGKLLVSATPGGTTALAAHGIASKALKSGALKPDHLKKASALTKAGSKGDDKALVKIAAIKAAAAKGDPHAAVALDRLKLAHALNTGKPVAGSRGKISQSYSQGLAALRTRRA